VRIADYLFAFFDAEITEKSTWFHKSQVDSCFFEDLILPRSSEIFLIPCSFVSKIQVTSGNKNEVTHMLTEKGISQAKPKDKLYRLSDNTGNSLSLERFHRKGAKAGGSAIALWVRPG
jgi:hypothetical protein